MSGVKLERRSALHGLAAVAAADASPAPASANEAPVTVRERRPLTILQVSAFAGSIDDSRRRLEEALGCAAPAANRFERSGAAELRGIGHGIWQLVGPAQSLPDAMTLRQALRDVATVVDLSHARTALQVIGPAAPLVLAQHCPIDLDPAQFPAGAATNTRFGHLGITLSRLDDVPTFELLVFRGYSKFVCEALLESAREFAPSPGTLAR
jgi:sarcosine oxidase subunit gamma